MRDYLSKDKVWTYSKLIEEFSNMFVWSYKDLKEIPPEVVEHIIPLIPRAKPIKQKEWRMNSQLQLLVRTEL